ncbi:ECF RNA polymerase sigma factor SigW [Candidatus Venteria ishoeyi]|uniref:RNA polymerase sigma factor n=1 Tax=Candidatus Venteria ishoeyi TaxID=1899563 RepID=A0A1H6FC39_9GAMM|nr:ECF RNA polymerase sigma factor SigW [Candidatus Venteria ishoeyi]
MLNQTVSKDMDSKQKRFEKLTRALHSDIYRYAYWLCGHAQIAEDLTQETFLRAWRKLDSLRNEKAAKAWLITIVRRENARRFEKYTPDFVDIELHGGDAAVDSIQEREHYGLQRAIARLEVEYREPLVLQVVGGFSGEEIAQILEMNPNTVATRLFRARAQLKALYQDEQSTSSSPQHKGQEHG